MKEDDNKMVTPRCLIKSSSIQSTHRYITVNLNRQIKGDDKKKKVTLNLKKSSIPLDEMR